MFVLRNGNKNYTYITVTIVITSILLYASLYFTTVRLLSAQIEAHSQEVTEFEQKIDKLKS